MLNALKFVRGAVAKKDYQPALTHFRIADGRVMGYNGTIALSSPIDIDFEATPKAIPFVKAIERCTDDTTVIHMTPGGKLALKSGRFKAYIDCATDGGILDTIVPEGEVIPMESGFIPGIKTLRPFVGTDASRSWAMGILLRGYSAYATNNIVLAEYWIGTSMPDINLPVSAVSELARVGQDPTQVMLGERSVTFFFEGDRWLRSQLLSTDWPDVGGLLDKAFEGANMVQVPKEFYEGIEIVAPFVDVAGQVYFRERTVATAPAGDVGASITLDGLPPFGAYHHKHLASLENAMLKIDFTKHPQPCPFIGDKLRGVLMGMVDA